MGDGDERAAEPLRLSGVRAVMVFCDDPVASCAWWAGLVHLTPRREGAFAWVDLPGGVELGFHLADADKNPSGASTVPYWSVHDLDVALTTLTSAGARLLRGPLEVEPGRRIAQVRDPYGAVMGIDDTAGHHR
ncbi:VOC family protein [Pseudokineococcus basanitobsidens]|uniref:VOC family protein n=1 Tax=Pseudokineococcus basanitobsidens TaxID=1926649 RepID=A0ABU8RMT8_9ACTN